MSIFSHPDFSDHEGVYFASDPETGLKVIIAVHSTARGPAAGGTRFWHYDTDAEAVTDALRLSKAMSYKNAAAELPLGGGKAVIMKPEGTFDRTALFAAYGRAIERLSGSYITAEDVGVTPADMDVIHTQTQCVAGLSTGEAASGDPSPITAEGVFRGLQVGAEHIWGSENLTGKTVAVQGLGHVGYALCEKLHRAGAKLLVADINEEVIAKAVSELSAVKVGVADIHAQEADIFAPCALGGALNAKTVPDMKAKLIAGAANNQLRDDSVMSLIEEKGIIYLPDYVLNAGGIINVAAEVSGEYNQAWVEEKLVGLKATIKTILEVSTAQKISTLRVANQIAEERLKRA
ncbi:leucine dehydrogenase [Litorimonas taeanensis]|uniref:Leucine dehydrogenase n=1 Tax=Litorimonas taeanensis TaxID=568099 RepID=A0A420WJN0_9PROT|nr:Glu/Leu/Phe/Val dehydrogenase dimerization domain-containing protein [Litorimonas taeanensis]RKQ71217.1 leucine dehydrogenase [Litorimonas taeanensis]